MKHTLAQKPRLGNTKREIGFAWLPKLIECGDDRTWIWFESYEIIWEYNPACYKSWEVVEWRTL